jgi:hypothetical protein
MIILQSLRIIPVRRECYNRQRLAPRLTPKKRIVLIDSDMLIRRNMDELMELELPSGWIAAAHACACNPRKLPHYPRDWYVSLPSLIVFFDLMGGIGYPKTVHSAL